MKKFCRFKSDGTIWAVISLSKFLHQTNWMQRHVAAAVIVFVALSFSVANAEIVTVEGMGHYFINRGIKENIDDACTHAYEEALRNATEKAGVRVKSYSRTINPELDEDIIETMTGAIIEVVGEPIFTNGTRRSEQNHRRKIFRPTTTELRNSTRKTNASASLNRRLSGSRTKATKAASTGRRINFLSPNTSATWIFTTSTKK